MTFNKKFPSLEKYDIMHNDDYDFIFSRSEIAETCIDKQHILDVIAKFKSLSDNKWTDRQVEAFLTVELGLTGDKDDNDK
jgi:hypothetical protein